MEMVNLFATNTDWTCMGPPFFSEKPFHARVTINLPTRNVCCFYFWENLDDSMLLQESEISQGVTVDLKRYFYLNHQIEISVYHIIN